jgi:hypothetical protein
MLGETLIRTGASGAVGASAHFDDREMNARVLRRAATVRASCFDKSSQARDFIAERRQRHYAAECWKNAATY